MVELGSMTKKEQVAALMLGGLPDENDNWVGAETMRRGMRLAAWLGKTWKAGCDWESPQGRLQQ